MIRPPAIYASIVYIGAIVLANVTTDRLGFVTVGFGLTVTAGTYFAGFALSARDVLQDDGGRAVVLGAIIIGAVLSWWLSNPALAFASGVAFILSELVDMGVYTPLRARGWGRAVLLSGMIGAVVDTITFVAIAFGISALTLHTVGGQLLGKLWVTIAFVLLGKAIAASSERRAISDHA